MHSAWKSYLSPLIYTKNHKEIDAVIFLNICWASINKHWRENVTAFKEKARTSGKQENLHSCWLFAQDMLDSKVWTLLLLFFFFLLVCRGKAERMLGCWF